MRARPHRGPEENGVPVTATRSGYPLDLSFERCPAGIRGLPGTRSLLLLLRLLVGLLLRGRLLLR